MGFLWKISRMKDTILIAFKKFKLYSFIRQCVFIRPSHISPKHLYLSHVCIHIFKNLHCSMTFIWLTLSHAPIMSPYSLAFLLAQCLPRKCFVSMLLLKQYFAACTTFCFLHSSCMWASITPSPIPSLSQLLVLKYLLSPESLFCIL